MWRAIGVNPAGRRCRPGRPPGHHASAAQLPARARYTVIVLPWTYGFVTVIVFPLQVQVPVSVHVSEAYEEFLTVPSL